MASFREAYPTATLNTIPRLPSISIVNYSMTPATGGDAFRAIESAPTGNVVEDDRRHFLQMVHRPLPQCIIVVKDLGVDVYTSAVQDVCWNQRLSPATLNMLAIEFLMPALSCSLSETLTAVSHCQQMREHELMCAHVQGFKALTGYQFPLVKTDECLFHWKQELRRKMLELRIPQDPTS
ncbi:hypothetical protein PR003_g11752 [Phytophthora rubi]|nr:hypothetical protein PR003_g11752 [Phytophthora rubi]